MNESMDRLPFRNTFDYVRGATFYEHLTPQSKDALVEILLDNDFMGATDPQALGMIYSLLANNRFSSVLQLGTWMGFSTIVLADALKRSATIHNREVLFDTIENDKAIHDKARVFMERAGLHSLVRCIDGSTLEINVLKQLQQEYDFIYVDSSHSYESTKKEITLYFPKVKKDGIIIFHDSSKYAAQWDPTGKGGVRRAIDEWLELTNAPEEYIFFESPFWSSNCGLFLARKK